MKEGISEIHIKHTQIHKYGTIDEPSPKDILNLEPTQHNIYQSRKYKFHVNKLLKKRETLTTEI